jgi:hypothetical protein
MIRIVSIVLLLGLTAVPFQAQSPHSRPANDLVRACEFLGKDIKRPVEAMDVGICLGYFNGFLDANLLVDLMNGPKIFCPDNGVTVDQLRKIFLKHMADHPEQLHLLASVTVEAALQKAFPCKSGSQ